MPLAGTALVEAPFLGAGLALPPQGGNSHTRQLIWPRNPNSNTTSVTFPGQGTEPLEMDIQSQPRPCGLPDTSLTIQTAPSLYQMQLSWCLCQAPR